MLTRAALENKGVSNRLGKSKCQGSSGAPPSAWPGFPPFPARGPCGLPCPVRTWGLLWVRANSWVSHFWRREVPHRRGLWRGGGRDLAPSDSSSLLQTLLKESKCHRGNPWALKAGVPAGASVAALAFLRSSWLSAAEEINGPSCWLGFLVADHLNRRIIYWKGSRKHTESMEIAEQAQPKGGIQGSFDTRIRSDCQAHSQPLCHLDSHWALHWTLTSTAPLQKICDHLLHPCATFQNLSPSDCAQLAGSGGEAACTMVRMCSLGLGKR